MLSTDSKSRDEKIVQLYSVDDVPISLIATRFALSNQAVRDVLRKNNALTSPAGRYSLNLRDRRRERKAKCGKTVSTN